MSVAFTQLETFIRGTSGENVVTSILQQRGWFVLATAEFSGKNDDKAPKLHGEGESCVMPDLLAFRNGEQRFVECKVKASATFTRMTGRYEHGVSLRLYKQYLRVQAITGIPVFIAIIEEDTGDVLTGRLDELAKQVRFYEGRAMARDRDGMAFFPRDMFQLLTNVK